MATLKDLAKNLKKTPYDPNLDGIKNGTTSVGEDKNPVNSLQTGINSHHVYKAGSDTRIFIEDWFVREAVKIEYTHEVQRIPYYGYDSVLFDTVLEGREIITGALYMNVIKHNQLILALAAMSGDTSILKNNQDNTGGKAVNVDDKNEMFKLINSVTFKKAETFDSNFNTERRLEMPKNKIIKIMLGDINDENTLPSFIELEDVTFLAVKTVSEPTAENIIEAYSFIAKKINYLS